MRFVEIVRRICSEDRGVTAVEYGLIASFISVVIIAGLVVASPAISVMYSVLGSDLSQACSTMGGSGC